MTVSLNLVGCRCRLWLPLGRRPAHTLDPFIQTPSPTGQDLDLAFQAPAIVPGAGRATALAIARGRDSLTFHHHGGLMKGNLACNSFRAPRGSASVITGQPWLMLALWAHLASRGGAFLHGALALVDGRFVALVGPPDVGKTTLANLVTAAGQYRLSDEHAFVRQQPGGIRAYGCPWPGVPAGVPALEGPLAAVFCLRQSPTHAITALSEAPALRRLIPATWFLNELSETVPLTMGVVAEIVTSVPVYDLAFAPDAGAVDAIRSVL